MNKIIFPPKLRTRGEPVADLQDALGLLLEKVVFRLSDAERRPFEERLRPERAEKIYSEATSDLIKVFQERNHLTPSGNADEQTAKALNAILEELVGARHREACRTAPA
jgi:murein L,D-transpeptidase YcbB/YkuD